MSDAFVGRHRQLAAGRDALDRVTRAQGGVLALKGDPGIGKTRLAREIAKSARAIDVEVVWSAGWPSGGAPAYWPWPHVLATIDPSARDALDVAPNEPESERFARFRRAADVIAQRTVETPLVIVLDDAHTMDADGLLLTRFLAQHCEGHRALLVLTHRIGPDVSSTTAELLDEIARSGLTFRLEGLSTDEVQTLIEASGDHTDADTVHRVCELTGGNPFLIEQVLEANLQARPGPVPDPARRLTEARLHEIEPSARAVVEAAAVLSTPLVASELAAVAGVDDATVQHACRQAAAVGLLRIDQTGGFTFVHELAREAVLASFSPPHLAELHGRCLAVLTGGPNSPERAGRQARHALARATYVPSHTESAVRIARESALVLHKHGAPEAAVETLEAALALHEQTESIPDLALLVDLGEALVATGRLRRSREIFRRAIAVAEDADDPRAIARASLGLGGVWVQEYRTPEAWRAFNDLIERALTRLADDDAPDTRTLRAQLDVRLVAERASTGMSTPADVRVRIDALRSTVPAAELVSGLSLLHHLMLGPQFANERVAVADELIDIARTSGDELHLAMGLLWRAVDEVLLGHDGERELGELRTRADALGMHAILFVADAIDVMRLLRRGQLDEAETAAVACHGRGVAVGDADAETYFAAHMIALNWYRGTVADLLPLAKETAAGSSTPANNPVFIAAVAALAAEAGEVDTAEHALAVLRGDGLDQLLPGSSWLITMFAIVEAASKLADGALAEEVYRLLEPFESLPTMGAIGVCCFGSTARTLGIAARTTGRLDDAVTHLERAIAGNQVLGNVPMTAIARADLAETLLLRGAADDRVRAAELLHRALSAAERHGLTGRISRWQQLLAGVDADVSVDDWAALERRGDVWLVTFGEEQGKVAATAGMKHLAHLVRSPQTDVPATELAGVHFADAPQQLLDETALREIRRQVGALESAIDDAWSRDDESKADDLQRELDELVAHLRTSVAPGGRSRRFDDASERARTSVQKAIRRAITAIGRDCPQLGALLAESVKTGYTCRYEPVPGAPARWDVRT